MTATELTQLVARCKERLTQEDLKLLLSYNPETGFFTRLVSTAHRVKIGDVAGSVATNGYRYICLTGKKYLAHRLAWFYVHGRTEKEIDHINGRTDDNRIQNLRPVTRSQNNQNQHNLRSDNTTGYRGVTALKAKGTFKAQAGLGGKTYNFGEYATAAEAAIAAKQGMAKIHTHNELAKK